MFSKNVKRNVSKNVYTYFTINNECLTLNECCLVSLYKMYKRNTLPECLAVWYGTVSTESEHEIEVNKKFYIKIVKKLRF